ncbi:MAG: molybdopterin-dependent oxidoreductase [Beijerinckiaceae bacterium]|nr:molybdopterin-dependent oxidoreductase [Beijerinckiaceae bacterium]
MITRRNFLEASGGLIVAAGDQSLAAAQGAPREGPGEAILSPLLPEGTRAEAVLEALPGKKPLIKLTYRPPNYESPLAYLRTAITPNDEFFVRYHLADIPQIAADGWRLNLGGEGAGRTLQIGLPELKKLPAYEIVAVCQCAGNRRGLFEPHVAGIQWGYGAIGCARWKGARLKDVLDLAGLRKEAIEVVFDGADGPAVNATPDFLKSIPISKALEDTTLIAYEMNGEPLPHWNGFPARLIVPGWTATYWVKHLTKIAAVTRPFDGFWMKTAYRLPAGKFPLAERFASQETEANSPITGIVVNSLITGPDDGARVEAGRKTVISGIAWDGGDGIRLVEVSSGDGTALSEATLGADLGKYAFRPWSYEFVPETSGKQTLRVRATNNRGQTQTRALIQNPAGYHHNVIQTLTLDAV